MVGGYADPVALQLQTDDRLLVNKDKYKNRNKFQFPVSLELCHDSMTQLGQTVNCINIVESKHKMILF